MKSVILLCGGTGFLGKHLSRLLDQNNFEVRILTRHPVKQNQFYWNADKSEIDERAFDGVDAVINLAGESLSKGRWTSGKKKKIYNSRMNSTRLLVDTLSKRQQVPVFISSSAIGIYGNSGDQPVDETTSPASDFLASTCIKWEEEGQKISNRAPRVVVIRTGIVLAKNGGALSPLMLTVKLFAGAPLGKGTQMMSWIHINDWCGILLKAITDSSMNGVYNAVAPHPATNKELVLQLAKKMRGNFFVPIYVPAFVLKMVLGEMSIEVLKSATVSNQKIRQAGFRYLYPSLEACIQHLSKELKV